jgi:pimeloyl-ACP methyl ester carboxylesterase
MRDPIRVDASLEVPVWFPAGENALFGILSRPPATHRGTAVVTLSGGGTSAPAPNRNRLSVRLGRVLASRGFPTLRFDYHGVGESTGVLERTPSVDEPYLADLEGAVRVVKDLGMERVSLLGFCFGSRTALSYASTLPGLQALVLESPPLRDLPLGDEPGTRLAERVGLWEGLRRALRPRTVRGLFHPARRRSYALYAKGKLRAGARRLRRVVTGAPDDIEWLTDNFVEPLRELGERRVPVLLIYGTEDHHYEDFVVARTGRLGAVLDQSPLTEVAVVEGLVHGLTRVEIQERVAELALDWITRHADGPARDARAAGLPMNGDGPHDEA